MSSVPSSVRMSSTRSRRIRAGLSARRPSRQSIHRLTVGHVASAAVEPTTSPKCPQSSVDSKTLARGAAAADGAHDPRRGDVVPATDEAQHRHVDVGEGHRPPLDHEPAAQHAVRHHELLDQLGEGRPRPGHPPLVGEEAALALPASERVTVVELQDELDPLGHRPERGPSCGTRRGSPRARDVEAA